jgi:hypothetical protein
MATFPDDVDILLCSTDACRCLGQVGRTSTLYLAAVDLVG